MSSKRTILFLVLLAIPALWWLFSGTDPVSTEQVSVDTNPTAAAVIAAPPIENQPTALGREELSTPEVVPEKTTPQAVEPGKVGTIMGRVQDSYGRQVLEGRVLVYRGKEQVASAELTGGGRIFRFELPAPHAYGLVVDPLSLNGNYMPPLEGAAIGHLDGTPWQPNDPRDFAKVLVPLEEGQVVEQNLEVGLPCKAYGQVVDVGGQPVGLAFVSITRLDALAGDFSDRTPTDAQGNFRFEPLYPGNYRLAVMVPKGRVPEGEVWNPPPPVNVLIEGGHAHDFGQLVVGAGENRIRGRLVDQDGNGFASLPVLCFSGEKVEEGLQPHDFGAPLATTQTDEEGFFLLDGLQAMPVQVVLTPGFTPGQALGAGHPAMWLPNIEVDLVREGPVVEIGTFTVEESRPFEVSGRIQPDPDWLAAGHHAREVRVELIPIPGRSLPEGVRRNPLRRTRLRILEDGTFHYALETPMPPFHLRVLLRGFEAKEYRIEPLPNQQWNRTIRVPEDLEKSP